MDKKLEFNYSIMKSVIRIIIVLSVSLNGYSQEKMTSSYIGKIDYVMPHEIEPHEGTWLQWPHHYQYGKAYRNSLDRTWVDMTKALVEGEKVFIIAYDDTEKERITSLLKETGVNMENIDFHIYKTDDAWVRDSGPIFVHDNENRLVVQNWGFNGWGQKVDEITGYPIAFQYCNTIPLKIAEDQKKRLVNVEHLMINEGGSIEVDGNGTLMACKSSVLNKNRNPGMTQEEAENIFTKYLGVTNFIWLEGQKGLELTDQHIDGFARFGNASTIVTMGEADLLEFEVRKKDIDILFSAKNKFGEAYEFVKVPLTIENVTTTSGNDLGYKGSYVNFYVANSVVLVPNYNDANDLVVNAIIQSLYPNRKVIGIDVRNLYQYGGMIHCVTQQQPQ